MKIIHFYAENYKRISLVDMTPDGHIQVIGGENAQGKTSVLDAIWSALSGGDASKAIKKPVKKGAEFAKVQLDLGDMVVTRTWDSEGKSQLKIENANGAKFASPQSVLDKALGQFSFDPLAFTRLNAKEQRTALLDLVDIEINLEALDIQYGKAYDLRTEINREIKALQANIEAIGISIDELESIPETESSASELLDKVSNARKINSQRELMTEKLVAKRQAHAQLEKEIYDLESEFSLLPEEQDTAELELKLQNVETNNAYIRKANELRALIHKKVGLGSALEGAESTLKSIADTKTYALANAKFPIDGLAFSDEGITYNGIPFDQVSASEQIKVSLAMAMALNPQIRVIRIVDGSLLDDNSMKFIEEMAIEKDYQIWIERVGDEGVGVVIEDGKIK